MKALKNDKKLIIFAASKAQKAVNYLHELQNKEVPSVEETENDIILEMEAA